jgi:signal transduction histidine kinase
MNHELRTPLNAIIGFTTMLKEGESYQLSEQQRRTYAEYVIQSADLLLGHINTILEAAALDSGSVAVRKSEVDVAQVLKDAIARAHVAAEAAEVEIENKTSAALLQGWGDSERLGQAADHLLRMAIRATPKGGKIFARAALSKTGAPEIALRDYGPGMEPATISKALSAFDEVHRGLDRSFAGPGIGLAIAKTFVEMQGGSFEIASRPGEGTVVRVGLPSAETQNSQERQPDLRKAG